LKHTLLTLAVTSLLATTACADPIHLAARNGDIEAVKQHLAAGTDVNAKGADGWTPLHYAAWRGKKEVAELLIANGADVNAKDVVGETPLHKAVIDGRKETAELLIAKGAEVNAKTKTAGDEWWTVLDWAELVRKIYVPGYKESPKLIAARKEIPDLLRKHGGMTGAELALIPRLVQHGRFAFSFDAKKGKVYEVQDSFDLLNWEAIKTYTGTGSSVRFDEERDHDPPKWFYRVRVVE
jgi:hypothetical protein